MAKSFKKGQMATLRRTVVAVRRTTNANFLIAANKQRLLRLWFTLDIVYLRQKK